MVEISTDNKNRIVSEVRHAFSRSAGNLGESGCVAWMFDKKGYISVPKTVVSEEKIFDLALDAGASDVEDEGEVWGITCDPSDFLQVQELLQKQFTLEEAN